MNIAEISKNLHLDENGIWTASNMGAVSYPNDGNRQCFQLEDKSYWFRHRNDCILAAIKRFSPSGAILDVGGGNGFVTRKILDEGFEAALLEPGPTGAFNAKTARGVPDVMCSTFAEAQFAAGSWSAIGAFDVFEHIEDDRDFIHHLSTALQRQGLLYGTVPAHPWLWSANDARAGHFRRYNVSSLRKLMGTTFEVLYITYFFGALLLPLFFFRSLPFRAGLGRRKIFSDESEHGMNEGLMVIVLRTLLGREVEKIRRGIKISVGTSCLFVARKVSARHDAGPT